MSETYKIISPDPRIICQQCGGSGTVCVTETDTSVLAIIGVRSPTREVLQTCPSCGGSGRQRQNVEGIIRNVD